MELIVPIDADISESIVQFGHGSKAIPSGARVLAIDIHTSDGMVRRLTDISKCEVSVHAVPPPRLADIGKIDRRFTTELQASADTVTTYDEPPPAKKTRRK